MNRHQSLSVAAFAVLLFAVAPAAAIQSGTHDGNGHPAVAWVIETNGTDHCNLGQTFTGSSATLVSGTVVLVSGSFASTLQSSFGSLFDNVWVNFDPENPFDCTKYEHVASIHVDPSFNSANLDFANLGALVLDATASVSPAALPVAGRLNGLPASQAYTAVAFGTDKGTNVLNLARRSEAASFRSLGPEVLDLRLTRNGQNAPCFQGFSDGGAAYVGSTSEVVGLNYDDGKGQCSRSGNFMRLDNQTARDFMSSLGVPLP